MAAAVVIPELERLRKAGPWCLIASQPSLTSRERLCLKEQGRPVPKE